MLGKISDQALFYLVDWARRSYFFRDLMASFLSLHFLLKLLLIYTKLFFANEIVTIEVNCFIQAM